MKRAYICSPLKGNIKQNINNAIAYSKYVYDRCGMIPIVPHLHALVLDDNDPVQRELGRSLGLDQLLTSSDVWVFGNTLTQGMQAELKTALQFKRTIHYVEDNECEEILREYAT